MSACVRNVFWFNSLFVLHILYIFHIFRLDHLTSTVPYFTHSPRMLWTRTCAVQTFRGRHQVLQSEGFRSGTLCTTLYNTCAIMCPRVCSWRVAEVTAAQPVFLQFQTTYSFHGLLLSHFGNSHHFPPSALKMQKPCRNWRQNKHLEGS